MPESWSTRLFRWQWNLYPPWWAAGARVTYIAADWREVRVEVRRAWRNRNYVGTIFGGSLYTAVDPVYMLMLMKNLGRDYVVWDKAAAIRFKKPGRSTLRAHFRLDEAELAAIRVALRDAPSVDRVYQVDLEDRDGTVCASVEKTIYVARKDIAQPRRAAARRLS